MTIIAFVTGVLVGGLLGTSLMGTWIIFFRGKERD